MKYYIDYEEYNLRLYLMLKWAEHDKNRFAIEAIKAFIEIGEKLKRPLDKTE